jgi:amino acid transporter
VIFAILPALAPMVVVAAVLPLTYARTGATALPLAFALVGVLLLLFSVGYLAASRRIPNTGVLYAYVAQGLGRPMGLGAAWLALLAYGAKQICLYGLIGDAVNLVLDRTLQVYVAWWVIALVVWALVTAAGVLRTRVRGRMLGFLACVELLAVIAFVLVTLLRPGPDPLDPPSIDVTTLFLAGSGAALVPVLFAFTGFESATLYAERTEDPRRTVAVGTYVIVLITALVSGAAAWAVAAIAGAGGFAGAAAGATPTELLFRLADARLPAGAVTFAACYSCAILAALVSWQAVLSRYASALARERIPTGRLGIGSQRSASIVSTMVGSAVALVVIVVTAVLRRDPTNWVFFRLGMAGAYGVLILLLLCSLAVVAYFARDARGENLVRRLVAPGLATMLLGGVAVLAGGDFGTLLGVDRTVGWMAAAAAPGVAALGLAWALVLRRRRPDRYRAIGLGPNSVTGLSDQDRVTPRPYAATHSLAPTVVRPARQRLADSRLGVAACPLAPTPQVGTVTRASRPARVGCAGETFHRRRNRDRWRASTPPARRSAHRPCRVGPADTSTGSQGRPP